MQVALDNSAAFERLSGIHGVNDLPIALFITEAITSCTERTGDRQGEIDETVNVQCRLADVRSFELTELSPDL